MKYQIRSIELSLMEFPHITASKLQKVDDLEWAFSYYDFDNPNILRVEVELDHPLFDSPDTDVNIQIAFEKIQEMLK